MLPDWAGILAQSGNTGGGVSNDPKQIYFRVQQKALLRWIFRNACENVTCVDVTALLGH